MCTFWANFAFDKATNGSKSNTKCGKHLSWKHRREENFNVLLPVRFLHFTPGAACATATATATSASVGSHMMVLLPYKCICVTVCQSLAQADMYQYSPRD